MKVVHYETTTRTTAVEIEVDDDATDEEINYAGKLHRSLHGQKLVSEREETWYVEDVEDVTQLRNPLHM